MDHEEAAQRLVEKVSTSDLVRRNLISATLLITAYETLRETITSKPLGFFSREWTPKGPKESDSYRSHVLSLHKNRFVASCFWFRENGAIEQADVDVILECRSHRNDVVHELLKYLVMPSDDVRLDLIEALVRVQRKIDLWWVREVEIPTNPDFDNVQVDEDSIQSAAALVFGIIRNVAQQNRAEGTGT
jgi:hypothetical protein